MRRESDVPGSGSRRNALAARSLSGSFSMHPRIVVLAAAVIAGTLPLSSIAQADNGKLDPDQAQAARKAIVAWLECKDCTEKDLRSILLYKDAPGFVASLAAALHNGP